MSSDDTSEAASASDPLLRAFLDGEARAYRQVERWARDVIRFRYFWIPRDEHDDLVQDTLTNLWRAASKSGFVLQRGLRAFVRVIASARCIDWIRKRRPSAELDAEMEGPGPAPYEGLFVKDERDRIHWAIRQLDEACREIVRLHFFEELAYAEIAARLGRAEATMRVRMFNCMKAIRRLIRSSDERPQAGAHLS